MNAFGAVFVEVRVDEALGEVRISRMLASIAAGKIVNEKTAKSQILGGMVWGVSMALHEYAARDQRSNRVMNPNLAEYHVPVNADIRNIDAFFIEENDEIVNPAGVKGIGEIGIVGTVSAIANAVYHATGKRHYDLPHYDRKDIGVGRCVYCFFALGPSTGSAPPAQGDRKPRYVPNKLVLPVTLSGVETVRRCGA